MLAPEIWNGNHM